MSKDLITKENKVIRNGKVGVLVSHGYGAGWSTWLNNADSVFDPIIVSAIWNKLPFEQVESYLKKTYPHGYFGGYDNLSIEWVKIGKRFRIEEYDGAETIMFEEDYHWVTA